MTTTASSPGDSPEPRSTDERAAALDYRTRLAREVADRLAAEGAVGVVIIGSVARRTATDDSDLDLLAVVEPGAEVSSLSRKIEHEVLVEVAAKTEADWVQHLQGSRPRWVYALLDGGQVLVDDGTVRRLRSMAERVLATFVTPVEVRAEIATMLWHGRAKAYRALSSGDDGVCGYWAALMLPTVLDGLFALYNQPCVPGSRRLDVLSGIVLDNDDAQLLDEGLIGTPRHRLEAVTALAGRLEHSLGPPDLERVEW
ncbi:MAG: nucleotidyltransferase domain-containing protein [Acidimicrobiales bacterium]